jgi:hypothetical protein
LLIYGTHVCTCDIVGYYFITKHYKKMDRLWMIYLIKISVFSFRFKTMAWKTTHTNYNGIHHQFPLNYISYIFYFRAVCYSILHVLLTLYGLLFKTFDKRDNFNFPIVNFPLICSNIPVAPAYGVYISQLIYIRISLIDGLC